MRVIIEADTQEGVERLAALLESDLVNPESVTVQRPPSRAERQAILTGLFDTYRIKLPAGWKFDRDQANER